MGLGTEYMVMATKPKPKAKTNHDQYRKKTRMVRVRERLAIQGDVLATRLAKTLTELTNDALREKLEEAGLWPPANGNGGNHK